MEKHPIRSKFEEIERKLQQSFFAIKQDMERIEKSKRPELTVSPVDYKLRADFVAFRNSILQEIDLVKETLLSFKQYNAADTEGHDDQTGNMEEQTAELRELREDIKELASIVVKKQKKYEQELFDVKQNVERLFVGKKKK
jgi:hypothetical protein